MTIVEVYSKVWYVASEVGRGWESREATITTRVTLCHAHRQSNCTNIARMILILSSVNFKILTRGHKLNYDMNYGICCLTA